MSERVVPFAVQPPLQLLWRRWLVVFWELQLFFLEEQIKYLLCFRYVEVKALHKPLLFDPLARNRVCPPSPFCYGHFLLLARVVRFICLGHVYMALKLVLVQLGMIMLVCGKLLHQVRQRRELQLKSRILDRLGKPEDSQIDCLLLCDARRVASVLNFSEALYVLRHGLSSLLPDLGEVGNSSFSSLRMVLGMELIFKLPPSPNRIRSQ